MSVQQVDMITNAAGTGGPAYPNGQVGVADDSIPITGYIGEIISNSATGVNVPIQSSGGTNLTSIVLTPGDWEVFGSFSHTRSTGSRVLAWSYAGLNTTSATLPTNNYDRSVFDNGTSPIPNDSIAGPVPNQTMKVAVSTTSTVYLVVQVNFSGGTSVGEGQIHARRMR